MAVPVRGDLQASLADLQGRQLRAQTRRFEQLGRMSRAGARPARLEDLLALPRQLLDTAGQRLGAGLSINVGVQRTRAARIAARLTPAILVQRTAFLRQSLSDLERRRFARMADTMRAAHQSVSGLSRQLNLLSHESVLQRGFALVTNASGKAVRRPDDAPTGSDVRILLPPEKILPRGLPRVTKARKPSPRKPSPRNQNRGGKAPPDDDAQGELL